ncbi:hypothetical protein BJ322DRAFT_1025881 [Thelephora terrestris]|uniref:Uncharacterized protein n=1 Tax=Thelephora terrestris TaxID=56493 RepID=A0A9P6KZZ7_9AGAM|nr:hypothetical protein BJ322DRAFT_1025881 [Thelephora terrestris]
MVRAQHCMLINESVAANSNLRALQAVTKHDVAWECSEGMWPTCLVLYSQSHSSFLFSPVQENNYTSTFSHARRDPLALIPLGSVMDRTATADPNEGFSDLGFRDFLQAARRVSRRKLARIETNLYANELLNRGVEFVTESNETFNSVLEASVLHTGNVGSMLMDEVAHVNERIDGRREEIEALENWKEDMQGFALLVVSELTGEVRDLQRRCNEPEVRVEEEEGRKFCIGRDTPRPEFVSTPWVVAVNGLLWSTIRTLSSFPIASRTLTRNFQITTTVRRDPNEIREQNWVNEELGNGGPGRGDLRMKVRRYMFTYYTSGLLGYLD